MPTIADICHSDSHLSDVQIHILEKSEPFLQFAADLAQRRLALFVPSSKEGFLVSAAVRKPLFAAEGKADTSVGAIVACGDEPVIADVFTQRRSLTAHKEVDYGRTESMTVYPFVDNGGKVIAVLSFTGEVAADKQLSVSYKCPLRPMKRDYTVACPFRTESSLWIKADGLFMPMTRRKKS